MPVSRRVHLLLTALVAAPAVAIAAEPPPSLLTDDMLERYRSERSCQDGRAFVAIQAALYSEAMEAEAASFLQQADAEALRRRSSADYDRAATVAAARGCPEAARALWNRLLQDDTANAALRARAEAGLRALPPAPDASGPAPR